MKSRISLVSAAAMSPSSKMDGHCRLREKAVCTTQSHRSRDALALPRKRWSRWREVSTACPRSARAIRGSMRAPGAVAPAG
eukprot:801432-Prymnesium_polylepis.3